MLRYVTALNKDRLVPEVIRLRPEVIRNLASRAFEIPLYNIVFDSATKHIFVRDVNDSTFANISLETGDVTLSNSFYSKQADRFYEMYQKAFLMGKRNISIDKKY